MNKATLQTQLQFIKEKEVGLELFFLYRKKKEDPIQILRAHLDGSIVQSRLERMFVNQIRTEFFNEDFEGKAVAGSIPFDLKHIKDVDELKDTYYFFPNEEPKDEDYHIPEEFLTMPTLKGLEYEKIDVFDFEKHLLEDVFAFLIRLQIDSEQVILFKQKYVFDILSRGTVLKIFGANILKHDTKFSLEEDPLLKINDKIDFVFIDNHFIILNLQLLETKYGFNERYLKRGIESLDIIKKSNLLVDTNKFDELITKVKFSKKVMKVKKGNEVLNTPVADMKRFLEGYKTKDGKHSLVKRIKYIPKLAKFQVTTEIGAEDFLRLLNDQYLISLLTKRPYISEVQSEFVEQ